MTFIARWMPCCSRSSGVLNRDSFARWLEITGLPVRSENPAGEARSAPTVATPTTPSPQPTPARTSSRFSDEICSRTLQNSACKPSAVSRAVSSSSLSKEAPCKAVTPSSANISCCRIRCCRARCVRSGPSPCGFGSTTDLSPLSDGLTRRSDICFDILRDPDPFLQGRNWLMLAQSRRFLRRHPTRWPHTTRQADGPCAARAAPTFRTKLVPLTDPPATEPVPGGMIRAAYDRPAGGCYSPAGPKPGG